MFQKNISMMLIGVLLNLTFYSSALAGTVKDAKFAEKVKTSIAKMGTGKEARIKIKLKDGTKLKGYVSEVKDSGFALTDDTGTAKEISYSQVKQAQGKGWSLGAKVLLIAVIVGVLTLIIWSGAQEDF